MPGDMPNGGARQQIDIGGNIIQAALTNQSEECDALGELNITRSPTTLLR